MTKRFLRLKHYLFPHAGNRYKPGIFAKESVAVIVLVLFLVEGVYLFHTSIILKNAGFLSAVLPAALTDMGNSDRLAIGAPALEQDALLAQAAEKKAQDMASKGYFSHVSPDGKTPWYWLDSVGYEYSYAGENLAINFTDSKDVETAWMNSPEHRANIVKPQYTKVGIGTAQGMYNGQLTTFVVELFATPAYAASPNTARNVVADKDASLSSGAAKAPAVPARKVLGVQVEKNPVRDEGDGSPSFSIAGALATFASSPNHNIKYVLGAFIAVVAVLLFLAIFVKVRMQYLEVILGGIVLIALAIAIVVFNGEKVSSVKLPSDAQAASVSLAF